MIADTLTRLQRALPAAQSGRLWEQLAAVLPPDRQPDREQPAAIAFHDGNPDAPQDLIDIAIEHEQAR